MDKFKNIYKAIIIMIIISLIVLCCYSLEFMTLGDDTSQIVFAIAIMIFIMSILFSRAANVIANRNNTIVGFVATIIGLIVLLIFTCIIIFIYTSKDITALLSIMKILPFIIYLTVYIFLLIAVFEIPQANSSHRKFQNILAIVITITFLLSFGIKNNSSSPSLLSAINMNGYSSDSSYYDSPTNYYTEDKKEDENSALEKAYTIFTFISLGGFLINPMLRVYYIDKDYTSTEDIDKILENSVKYQANSSSPNPNKILDEKYKNPEPTPTPKPQIETPTEPVVEIPHEKVVNPNFKQEDLPEAIIPSINVEEPVTETQTPAAPTAPEATPATPTTPTTNTK